MRSRGNDPFAQTRYDVDATAAELAARYGFLEPARSCGIRKLESRGADSFQAQDGQNGLRRSGRSHRAAAALLRKDEIGEARFADWDDIERGDIVGVRGYMFRSKMGELTLHVTSFVLLAKSLMPLPDKWHGLHDVEKRYRQRYVDLIVNPDVRDTMIARSRIVAEMRRFIDERGFYEVETPTLLHVAGGAAARPFVTHVNALDQVDAAAHRDRAEPQAPDRRRHGARL